MSQVVEITINKVAIGVRHDAEACAFVGFCPRFKVYSQGDTKEEAIDAVADAVSLRLSVAFDHGRIESVLRQAGFGRVAGTGPGPGIDDEFVSLQIREDVEITEVGIRVPLGALLQHRSAIECPQ